MPCLVGTQTQHPPPLRSPILASGDEPQRMKPQSTGVTIPGVLYILAEISPRESPAQHCSVIHKVPLTSKTLQKSSGCVQCIPTWLKAWETGWAHSSRQADYWWELRTRVLWLREDKSFFNTPGKDKLSRVIPLPLEIWIPLFFSPLLMGIFFINLLLTHVLPYPKKEHTQRDLIQLHKSSAHYFSTKSSCEGCSHDWQHKH